MEIFPQLELSLSRSQISSNRGREFTIHNHDQHRLDVQYGIEDDVCSIPTVPPLDLHKIYASARVHRGKRARSMSSFTTEWSTTTAKVSNTTTKREAKKQQKRRFVTFMKILMRLLEKKDPVVYHNAQVVIHDCEEKKKKGEAESVVESLRSPLKDVVGQEYWNEARNYSKEVLLNENHKVPSETFDDELLAFNMADLSFLNGFSSPLSTTSSLGSPFAKEERIRKKRLWMIICVLMKYLMRKDATMYLQAKDLVSDCVRRHRGGEDGYRSLSHSIQSCLKQKVGSHNWKRAEKCVAKFLSPDKTTNPDDDSILWSDNAARKRSNHRTSFKVDSKRQKFHEI